MIHSSGGRTFTYGENEALKKQGPQIKPLLLAINEVWKPVKGYEEYYATSNWGRVKSFDRVVKRGWAVTLDKGRILAQKLNNWGYPLVRLSVNKKHKDLLVHKAMMEAFVPNPDNLPQINHKDEIKTHNYIHINPDGSVNPELSNLEWCTASYNVNYGTRNKRTCNALKKKVLQYTINGELVGEYNSVAEANRITGYAKSPILRCCRGESKYSHGYIWKFKQNNK